MLNKYTNNNISFENESENEDVKNVTQKYKSCDNNYKKFQYNKKIIKKSKINNIINEKKVLKNDNIIGKNIEINHDNNITKHNEIIYFST